MKLKKLQFLIIGLLFINISLSATHTVKGVVTSSEDGSGIPGANVVIEGTYIGCVTDIDGKYTINVTPDADKLVYSAMGFEDATVAINGQSVINVVLEPADIKIQEVVVVAYGTAKKKSFTGSVSVVSAGSYNNESYSKISENGFKRVSRNPLSTFSVDVDGASYSNIRRMIDYGDVPGKDAVRVEEMINYFSYDYPEPNNGEPFSIYSEYSSCPWNKKSMLMHIGLKGKSIEMDEIPPSNIVFLLDVSGSMDSPEKLPLLKSSLKMLLKKLGDKDRVAIVVYAGNSGVILPSTSCKNTAKIIKALDDLDASGSTAGGEGLRLAYKIAKKNFIKGGNNRVVMATDGDFNVGESSVSDMENLIEEQRKSGVFISVLGFGMGNYKDNMLEVIANKGNGNYYYIDNLLEAKKVLVSEFGGTFHTVAKDVKLQLEFNPYLVSEYRLIGYENRLLEEEDFDDDKKDAGEIGAGHTVTALYEIILSKSGRKRRDLKYQKPEYTDLAKEGNELVTVNLRYKEPKGRKSLLLSEIIYNNPVLFDKTSDNFRFSASVAEFGMILKESEYKGNATLQTAMDMAKRSKGKDDEGYRAEMIKLIETVMLLKEEEL
ncbi:MAG: von Willebrand factor type A domain-containing protein [Bacteroidales bacterium]|jgi:Ca-activated chloride channel family protein|nr:von Willebrand factor type A domain-containing protein [Bacteroidales bacterium]